MVRQERLCALTQYGLFRSRMFDDGLRFEERGPFSEPGWGWEDNDFMFQMNVAGWKCLMVNGIIYRHDSHSSIWNLRRDQGDAFFLNYEQRREFLRKKWGMADAWVRKALNTAPIKRWWGDVERERSTQQRGGEDQTEAEGDRVRDAPAVAGCPHQHVGEPEGTARSVV